MQRLARLDSALRVLMGERAAESPRIADPFCVATDAFGLLCDDQFEAGADLAAEALAQAVDADARALARAVAGLAAASWPPAHESFATGDPLKAAIEDRSALTPDLAPITNGLLAEAALACARLELAIAFTHRAGEPPATLFGAADHPYLTFMRTSRARVLAFHGNIAEAERWVDEALSGAEGRTATLLARGTAALVLGNADHRRETLELVEEVASSDVERTGVVARGCSVLASFGAIAIGDLDRAAQLMLRAGGDADLSRLRIIDRVLGLEMLVALAVAAEDREAAEAWQSRAEPLRGHPIAESTVHRIDSRVAFAGGNGAEAIAAAERAIARARLDGRAVEEAEAEILLGRARILHDLRGDAVRGLIEAASSAESHGYLAVRRSAARELRRVGRRLPPSAGWDGLSDREREVATLLATGASNADLARALFVSEHTVRMHVSRVLQAFGVATRAGVVAAIAPSSAPSDPPPLTARQREVVEGIVAGCSNRELAQNLGIAEATVEKHVGAILERWGVASRAGIVGIAVSARPHGVPV